MAGISNKWILALATLALAFSCTREAPLSEPQDMPGEYDPVVRFGLETYMGPDNATKTTYAGDDQTSLLNSVRYERINWNVDPSATDVSTKADTIRVLAEENFTKNKQKTVDYKPVKIVGVTNQTGSITSKSDAAPISGSDNDNLYWTVSDKPRYFYAVYPAVAGTDFSDAPDVHTAVPEIQTPTAGSFDPAADLMAGESVNSYRSFPSGTVPLKWTRLVAHGDITLKALPLGQGETIRDIVLMGQSGAELTGDVVIDLGCPEDFATDGKPRVTVMADNLTVDANGNLNFWISIFPTTLTELTVTVDTDKASYRKTFSNISKTFTQNARNILGVNMADAVKTSNDLHYVKVTSALTDWTGDYLIVYEPDALVLDSDGDAKTHASVTIEDGKIAYESASAYNIHVQKSGSGYSMKMGARAIP